MSFAIQSSNGFTLTTSNASSTKVKMSARLSGPLRALDCICGKEMYDANDGICVWCGHGDAKVEVEQAYRRNMESDGHPEFAGPSRVVPMRRARARVWSEDQCVSAHYAWWANHGREPKSTDWNQAVGTEHRPSYKTVQVLFGGWEGFKQYIAEIPRDQVAE